MPEEQTTATVSEWLTYKEAQVLLGYAGTQGIHMLISRGKLTVGPVDARLKPGGYGRGRLVSRADCDRILAERAAQTEGT